MDSRLQEASQEENGGQGQGGFCLKGTVLERKVKLQIIITVPGIELILLSNQSRQELKIIIISHIFVGNFNVYIILYYNKFTWGIVLQT